MGEKQWVIKINEELKKLPDASTEEAHWSKRSIYKIPASVTDINKRAYKPQILSLGPYHHGIESLKAMEEHKHRALLHFLKRSNKPLQSFIDALTPVVKDLQDAYDQLDPMWLDDDDRFLELMIVDGCFLLEILHSFAAASASGGGSSADHAQSRPPPPPHDQHQPHAQAHEVDQSREKDYASNDPIFSSHASGGGSSADHAQSPPPPPHDQHHLLHEIQIQVQAHEVDQSREKDYASNDPIFSSHGKLYIVPYLQRDMLMLENQLPMLVLQKLVAIQKDKSLKDMRDLTRRILKFLYPNEPPKHLHHFNKCLHILDIYRHNLLLDDPKPKRHRHNPKSGLQQGGDDIIRSATELNEAGIRIQKSRSRSLKDISFHHGVLKLPLVVVDDALESLYLNLIAFERFHVGAGNEVTSYIFFMDNMIDSARDVSLLHSCGIIQNALGSDKAVASLFNSLSKDVTLDPKSSLGEVHKEVSAYCQKAWHQWRANLMHTYFTNPWAILSVIAAIFLFALTILQTIYSVLSYVSPP